MNIQKGQDIAKRDSYVSELEIKPIVYLCNSNQYKVQWHAPIMITNKLEPYPDQWFNTKCSIKWTHILGRDVLVLEQGGLRETWVVF